VKSPPKTTFNIWRIWTTAAKAAAGQRMKDKFRKLRVRGDNPCAVVAVPRDDRRLYALATYLFLGDGELKALTWPDVDSESGIASIRHSFYCTTGRIKQTKTATRASAAWPSRPSY